jgi:hypothetical protein
MEPKKKPKFRRTILWPILTFVVLYYPVGMMLIHRIHYNTAFGTAEY